MLGQSLWLAIVSYICSLFGALQVPVFLLVMVYVGISIVYQLRNADTCSYSLFGRVNKLLDRTDFEKAINQHRSSRTTISTPMKPSDIEDISMSEGMMDSIMEGLETCDRKESTSTSFWEQNDTSLSRTYFKFLSYACLATFLYRNIWVLLLCSIPTVVHLLFTVSKYTGFTDFVCLKVSDISGKLMVIIELIEFNYNPKFQFTETIPPFTLRF